MSAEGVELNGADCLKAEALTEAEKDQKIAQLIEQNQQLLAKTAEQEETIEMYKTKAESLEEQLEDLKKINTTLIEKLEAIPPTTPKTPINRGYSDGDLDSEPRKVKKPLPPLPPGGVASPSGSWISPIGGWSSGSISRRSDSVSVSKTTRSSLMFSKEMTPLQLNTPPDSPSLRGLESPIPTSPKSSDTPSTSPPTDAPIGVTPTDDTSLNNDPVSREERAQTSPIPAPSPNLIPTLNRSATSSSLNTLKYCATDLVRQLTAEAEEVEEEEEDNPDLILATNDETGKVMVKGGTLDKLVERLSYEKSPDADFVAAFLLTYRSFTTQIELLDKLISRYNIPPKEGCTPEEEASFTKRRKIIRLRVGNALKMWVDKHFHDFEKDQDLVQKLSTFVDSQLMVDLEAQAKIIKKLLFNERGPIVYTWSEDPPALISPKPKDFFKDFDPLEVARQLTLIEQDLYRRIENKECLNQAWNKPDKEEKSPHIVAMIKRFNLVSVWVATEIVKTEKLADRVTVLKKFITIAEKCREIGNFNAIMEILAGLQNSAIYRLKKTWEKVFHKSNYEETYNSLMALMNNKGNFKDYRAALHKCHPPCIPYLGVYLTDLTFIEDGMKNTLNGRDDLINFDKRRKLSTVIHEIQQYQQTPYHFSVEDTIRAHVLNIEGLTEKALYKYSLLCEPREGKGSQESFKKEFSLPSFLSFSK